MTPKIAFLAAAGPTIGGGHVVRSVSIANALAASGAVCTFFNSTEAIAAAPLLSHSGHRLVTVSYDKDAALAAAGDCAPFDWLVVDDYSLAADEESSWRTLTKRILAVDDLANRAHDCDLLLDSTPSRNTQDYVGLVPQGARLLIGAAYPPLRPEFFLNRPAALKRREQTRKPRRLLVSFGLVDPEGITAHAVSTIAHALPDLAIDIVLGPASGSSTQIQRLARPNIQLHIDPPSMAELMMVADIALGAGGSTAWERACLGLPSIALMLADNQRELAQGLEKRGALIALRKNAWPDVISALRSLLDDEDAWRVMSSCAAQACDGLGANRVALELNPLLSKRGLPIRLRPAEWNDSSKILAWQSMPGAREFSSDPRSPTRHEHESWMARKLKEPHCIFNIIEENETPSGVLRLDQRLDGSYMVSILVADRARGQGVGLAAIHAASRLVSGHILWAKIAPRNTASLRIFAKAGFSPCGDNLHRRKSDP